MKRFHWALLAIAVLAAGTLAGCGTTDDTADEVRQNLERVQSLVNEQGFRLPDIPVPVDIGEDGRVTQVAGVDVETIDQVAEQVTGNPLFGRIVLVNREQLDWLKRANIQHVTVASRPQGLMLMVNGQALPYLAWDAGSVEALVKVLGQLVDDGTDGIHLLTPEVYRALEVALPLVRNLGMRFDIRFPRDPAQEEVRLPEKEDFAAALEAYEREERERRKQHERDERPLQKVDLEIEYRPLAGTEDWVPSIFGFTTVDLNRVGKPLDLNVPQLRLRQDIRRRLQHEGIESIALQMRYDGLYVQVDDRLLPHLAWSETSLTNVTALLWELYPEGSTLPKEASWVPLVRDTAPMYNDLDIAVRFHFPTAE